MTCDGDDIKADVSMCYVLLAFPDFLNYFSYTLTLYIVDEMSRNTRNLT